MIQRKGNRLDIPAMKVPDPIEKELEALKVICQQLSGLQHDTQARIINFMKSKFRDVWPYEVN